LIIRSGIKRCALSKYVIVEDDFMNNISKAGKGDIETLAHFASENGYSEFSYFNYDKKIFFKNKVREFTSGVGKSIFYLTKKKDICGVVFLEDLPFDSELFNTKAVNINDIILSRKADRFLQNEISGLLLDFVMKINDKAHFIQCKLDSRNIEAISILPKYGFKIVSQDLNFFIETENSIEINPDYHNLAVCPCDKEDIKALYKISLDAFTTTRFHNDLNIPNEKADELQALWIRNCYSQNLADTIIVLKKGKDICGYVACKVLDDIILPSNQKIGRIILIAVDKKYQRKGIGSVLIQESLKWFKQRCSFMVVGTQIINLPAISLYQKNGCRLFGSKVSFHFWRR